MIENNEVLSYQNEVLSDKTSILSIKVYNIYYYYTYTSRNTMR